MNRVNYFDVNLFPYIKTDQPNPLNKTKKDRALEFSSLEIDLRNRVTQNDVTLRVTNSETFIEILLLSY